MKDKQEAEEEFSKIQTHIPTHTPTKRNLIIDQQLFSQFYFLLPLLLLLLLLLLLQYKWQEPDPNEVLQVGKNITDIQTDRHTCIQTHITSKTENNNICCADAAVFRANWGPSKRQYSWIAEESDPIWRKYSMDTFPSCIKQLRVTSSRKERRINPEVWLQLSLTTSIHQ